MALPGLLIEYLISGALALIWLIPLLKKLGVNPAEPATAMALAVLLYVIGMAVDFVAFWLVRPIKPFVRSRAFSKHAPHGASESTSSIERQVRLSLYAPELAKEVVMRSSRDRIARGAVLNALIAFILEHVIRLYPATIGVAAWIVLILLLIAMWYTFEYVSFGYELRAERALNDKLREK